MDVVLAGEAQTGTVGGDGQVDDSVIADFDAFYRRSFAGLVVLAVAVTGQRAGAEDVVQDAMLDAHRRWDRVGGYDAPRSWVRRVVIQRAMKVGRKRANERRSHLRAIAGGELAGTDGGSTSERGLDPELREALRALAPQQRAVLALHYLEDLSVRDTAELLGIADLERLDLARAWAQRPTRDQLRVPIGVTLDGQPVDLDLKESA